MKIWKKNAVIVTVLVLVCAGIYLNWLYAEPQAVDDLTDVLNEEQILGETTLVMAPEEELVETAAEELAVDAELTDYFAAMRLSRQEARAGAVTTLQETIAYAGEGEDVTTSAETLEKIMAVSLQEAQIESMIIAKGYTDCVAYMTEDLVTVAVPAPEEGLMESDVALLSDVIMSQSDYQLADIRIIEVK